MLIKHVVIRIKNICYNFKHEIKAGGNVMKCNDKLLEKND